MEDVFRFMVEDMPRIIEACLAVIGGLKVLARYTPIKGDDKVLEKIEKPVKVLAEKFPRKKK